MVFGTGTGTEINSLGSTTLILGIYNTALNVLIPSPL
jgi:hypothetical protein